MAEIKKASKSVVRDLNRILLIIAIVGVLALVGAGYMLWSFAEALSR